MPVGQIHEPGAQPAAQSLLHDLSDSSLAAGAVCPGPCWRHAGAPGPGGPAAAGPADLAGRSTSALPRDRIPGTIAVTGRPDQATIPAVSSATSTGAALVLVERRGRGTISAARRGRGTRSACTVKAATAPAKTVPDMGRQACRTRAARPAR